MPRKRTAVATPGLPLREANQTNARVGVPTVLGDVVEVVAADDDGVGHLAGGDNETLEKKEAGRKATRKISVIECREIS